MEEEEEEELDLRRRPVSDAPFCLAAKVAFVRRRASFFISRPGPFKTHGCAK